MITLLRSAQLILQIEKDGYVFNVGIPGLLKAIEDLNLASEQRLFNSNLEKETVLAVRQQQVKDRGIVPYGTNPEVSLCQFGITYASLHVPRDTPVLSDGDRANLLETICMVYDFDRAEPKSKGEMYDAWLHCQRISKQRGGALESIIFDHAALASANRAGWVEEERSCNPEWTTWQESGWSSYSDSDKWQ